MYIKIVKYEHQNTDFYKVNSNILTIFQHNVPRQLHMLQHYLGRLTRR